MSNSNYALCWRRDGANIVNIIGSNKIFLKNGYYSTDNPDLVLNSSGNPQGRNDTDVNIFLTEISNKIMPIQLVNPSTTYNNITFYPGVSAYGDPELNIGELKFLDNSVITFDARGISNAVFLLGSVNITFGDNVSVKLLNNARHTNIIFVSTHHMTFTGTSSMSGMFLSSSIVVDNLCLRGSIATGKGFDEIANILTVNGSLHIDASPDDIISDICSDICFAKNTPIQTDQGIVMIQELKTGVHTIKREPIVAITRTISLDDFLICFEKHTFERNCPSERTIVSKEQKILYKDKMISAHKLMIPRFVNFVHKIPYDGQPLYNILLKNHGTVLANNLVCETLDPKSIIAQLYSNNLLTDEHVVTMNESMILNHEFKKKNVFKHFRL